MKWASALSLATQTSVAVDEVVQELRTQLGKAVPDALFVFVSPHHRPAYSTFTKDLIHHLGPRHLMGCSAAGVIGNGHEAEQVAALSVTAAVMPGVDIKALRIEDASLPDLDSGPRSWEEAMGVKASADPHFLVLVDPFSIRADEMLAGLDFAFPNAVKIGGLASGARRPGQNALYLDSHVFRDGAIGLALSGDIRVETLVAQGCRPFGRPLLITKCHRNVLLELDHRPALEVLSELYKQASERDRQLIPTSLFLGLVMDAFKQGDPQPGDFLIRTPIGMDTEKGALVISAVLRERQTVQFHLRDALSASEDLSAVLRRYATERLNQSKGEALPPPPRGALMFSCLGRGKHLYGKPDHDTAAFQAQLGDVPLGGFFCNGEIGPVSGTTHIHGFTSCFGIFRSKSD
ncbi:MAG TPA: FIST N-terminal domain-containing protein [Planctomycetota bacterium]|nr:FIST N-terminal domain-containing protein [Planctomycetota bacterium]